MAAARKAALVFRRRRAKGCILKQGWAIVLVTTTVIGACGRGAQATVQYSITDLGTLGLGTNSVGLAINNQGAAIGYAYTGGDSNLSNTNFLYDGTMHDLKQFGTPAAGAKSINDSSQIAGYY